MDAGSVKIELPLAHTLFTGAYFHTWRNHTPLYALGMANDLLRDNPELRPFVLSNVRLTGIRIGAGAYASVEEVAIPVNAAAKKIHEVFLDRSEIPDDEVEMVATDFVKECQLTR